MSRRFSPAATGGFVIGAVVVAVVSAVALGGRGLFASERTYVAFFAESVHGLTVGAPVEFQGIHIGTVSELRIDIHRVAQRPQDVRIPVLLAINEDLLTASGDKGLEGLVAKGLRAQLAVNSMVTGVRYIDLDMRPDTEAVMVNDPTLPYPEIPTLPATTSMLQARATDIMDELSQIDLPGLVASVQALVDAVHDIAASPELRATLRELHLLMRNLNRAAVELQQLASAYGPEGPVGRDLQTAIQKSGQAANALQTLLHPDGGFSLQLEDTLTEVDGAARSLRTLTEQISRDPASLIRGGAP